MPKPKARKTTKITTNGNTVRIETPKTHSRQKPEHHMTVMLSPNDVVGGFVGFVREHAIVGLAVGFVIGTQVQTVVKQLVTSFIAPLFQLFFGQSLITKTSIVHWHGRAVPFAWGAFFYGLLNFVFVLAAIYAVIKIFNLDKLDKPVA